MSFFRLVSSLATEALRDESIRRDLIDVGGKVFQGVSSWLDSNNDGVLDRDDQDQVLTLVHALGSLFGHVAQADGEVSPDERGMGLEACAEIFLFDGEDALLGDDVLAALELDRAEVLDRLRASFDAPGDLGEVAEFAIAGGFEELFYSVACLIAAADGQVLRSERDFLKNLASLLGLSRADRLETEKAMLLPDIFDGWREEQKGGLIEWFGSYLQAMGSLLAHAALADGVIQEAEIDEGLVRICGEWLFSEDSPLDLKVMVSAGISIEDAQSQIVGAFDQPIALAELAAFATIEGMEGDFYRAACLMLASDQVVRPVEREFLAELAAFWSIAPSDRRVIEHHNLQPSIFAPE